MPVDQRRRARCIRHAAGAVAPASKGSADLCSTPSELGVLQTQMDNLSVQATLIIGFALSMWAGETLTPLLEDESQICIWKSWYHLLFATCFFMLVAVCISCCLIIVSIVSYIKQAAQEAALIVSTGAAVACTRYHLRSLNYLFVLAYTTFTLSAVLLIILYDLPPL